MMGLLERWRQLLINFSVSDETGEAIFEEMLIRYGEDGRYYHTIAHVEQVLDTIAELRSLAEDYPALQLAAWFHDIIYNPQMADNEAQSAVYAESVLTGLSVPAKTVRKVSRMIRATADHTNPANDPNTMILLDADLAILGSDEAGYLAYSQAIRLEYSHVPEAAYRNGRIAALNRFLKRPRIYHTPLLYERLEAQARANMMREIGRLS
jgi:predicted metal-dependent HD superfamily phosphohydrolase